MYIYSTLTSMFAPVLTAVQILAPRMFSHALGQEASYTVLIDLGLADLRSVRSARDSVARSAKLRRLAESF